MNGRGWIAALAVGVLLTTACARGRSSSVSTFPEEPPSGGEEYLLGTGDVFNVRVYGEEELSAKYQVGPEGTIDFPFIGRVEVRGKSGPEVAAVITTALEEGEYLRSPQVSVFVQEMTSKRVSIVGAVAKPGSLVFVPGMTVVQALSLSGGFTALADRDGTVVTRRTTEGKLRKIKVPAGRVQRGDAEDVALRPGDIVFVPERLF